MARSHDEATRAQIGRWSEARRAPALMCTPAASMLRSLWTMIRSSCATGWRAWKLGPVGAMWNSGSSSLQAAGGGAPFVGVAHQHRRHLLRPAGDRLEDRAHLPPPPKPGQVEVHADDPQRPVADQQLGHHRAARLERRQVERGAAEHADVPLHQDRVAVPADVARVDLEQPVGVLARFLEHALVADSEMHRLVQAVAVDQLVRNGRSAPADALVGLLQRDDVGVDLLQHVEARGAGRAGRRARPPCACCSWRG